MHKLTIFHMNWNDSCFLVRTAFHFVCGRLLGRLLPLISDNYKSISFFLAFAQRRPLLIQILLPQSILLNFMVSTENLGVFQVEV